MLRLISTYLCEENQVMVPKKNIYKNSSIWN